MADKTPYDPQRLIPYLLYRDAAAAIEFHKTAFGMTERELVHGGEGQVLHAELTCEGNVLMLGGLEGRSNHATPAELAAR